METQIIASRNIVDLVLSEQFNASICPVEVTRSDGYEGVYGWDC